MNLEKANYKRIYYLIYFINKELLKGLMPVK